MWDRGWSKVYEVVAEAPRTEGYQRQLGERLATLITCLHPFYVTLRGEVSQSYR